MPAKNTGAILQRLRSLMKNSHHVSESVHAYIIPTDDAHQSEYIAEHDKRRTFVSGFTGSSGTAIVTESKAALWTDGRYYLQAEAQLDANWTLMKDGLKETPSQAEWLCKVLPVEGRVGADPYLLSQAQWSTLSRKLTDDGHKLVAVNDNLVDLVWDDQPESPNNSVIVQPIQHTGQSWEDKVKAVRAKLQEKNAHCVVVSALDEVAWLLNLRGSDIQFNPCFFAYAIVTMDAIFLFVDEKKLSDDAVKHLGLQQNGNQSNSGSSEYSITLLPYSEVITRLRDIADATDKKTWMSSKSSCALFDAIPEKKRLSEYSPVNELKAVKNSVEITGMKNAHIRDAVALCEYFWWLEKEVPKGGVTEMSGSDKLEELRRAQADFVSLSFDTISGSGPNGAIIHYRSSEETNRPITTDQLYLCDSGAQYRDGTTDVTRTIHLGTPSDYERECFTHVLKGHIALASCIWPNGVKGLMLDSFARASLWQSGLDYLHGTGHGVGSFLNVHEGPCGISYRPKADDVPLAEGMILSDEPSYYEDGKFGVRIESLVLVTKAQTKYNFRNKGFLTFEPITLVPIQRKMILPELLTEKEVSWLNEYHEKCRDVIGEELKNQNKTEVLDWLMKETQPIG